MKVSAGNWFLLILLALIWGASFILMKRGMYTLDGEPIFSSSQVGALRMCIASLAILPISVIAIKQIKNWRIALSLIGVGLFGNFFPAFLFTYAETGITSGYAGMLNGSTPVFALLISSLIYQDKLNKIQILGTIVGIIGVVTLSLAGQSNEAFGGLSYVLAILLATFMYGISINLIKHQLGGKVKPLHITALAFFMLIIPSWISFFLVDTPETIVNNPHALEGLGYIILLSVVGTAFAVAIYSKIIAETSTLFASSVTYLIPIVATCIGFLFNEQINLLQIAGMLIILGGVFIANYLGSRKQKRQSATA